MLCGGPSAPERQTGAAIEAAAQVPRINLNRPRHAAGTAGAARRAPPCCCRPDSGPAHMATMVGTPVIGLYAGYAIRRAAGRTCRSGGASIAYGEAARRYRAPRAQSCRGRRRSRLPGVMDLVAIEAVCTGRSSDDLLRSRAMQDILVPVSPGELLDKITILRIKAARITRADKLANVRRELEVLEARWRKALPRAASRSPPRSTPSSSVNERLWDVEDLLRDLEAEQLFDRDSSIWRARSTSITTSAPRSRNASTCSLGSRLSKRSPTGRIRRLAAERSQRRSVYSAPQ